MNIRICADICIVISALGFLFMTYLLVLTVFDPDRLHIIKHINADEDRTHYTTAWVSAFTASLIYLVIGGGLFYRRYGSQVEISNLLDKIQSFIEKPVNDHEYELHGNPKNPFNEISEAK